MNLSELIETRRYLHKHPELSNQEKSTHAYLFEKIEGFGLSPQTVAGTGIKVTIDSGKPGRHVAYRADIDALPIQEENTFEYASIHAGVMHACGHDVHTAVGLGLVSRFATTPPEHGSVTFIFQPAEEGTPADTPIGAEQMVCEGVLTNPKIDEIYALHCMPDLEVGAIGYTCGAVWSESALVEIEIEGKSCHAAYPNQGIDTVVVAAQIILALQTVVSRSVDSRESLILTIGKLESGATYNVVANHASMVGTMRTLNKEVGQTARERIKAIVDGVCAAYGATGKVKFTNGAQLTANDLPLEESAVAYLREHEKEWGGKMVRFQAQMASEDFSSFSTRTKGCYLFLGVGESGALHTCRFNIDEACLGVGADGMETLLRWRLSEV